MISFSLMTPSVCLCCLDMFPHVLVHQLLTEMGIERDTEIHIESAIAGGSDFFSGSRNLVNTRTETESE